MNLAMALGAPIEPRRLAAPAGRVASGFVGLTPSDRAPVDRPWDPCGRGKGGEVRARLAHSEGGASGFPASAGQGDGRAFTDLT